MHEYRYNTTHRDVEVLDHMEVLCIKHRACGYQLAILFMEGKDAKRYTASDLQKEDIDVVTNYKRSGVRANME